MKPSAILEVVGVNEIGQRSLLTSKICLVFGTGDIFACFQEEGSSCFLKEAIIMLEIGSAKVLTKYFKSQLGRLSGPETLSLFN